MDKNTLRRQAEAMADAIRHRGPDDGQVWVEPRAGVGLGFRRLSIIDLSTAGQQPMQSASKRFVICFNGEIYNAEALRREFGASAPQWRGHSDTEVLLEACAKWGVENTARRLIGMFAFALFDRETRELHLVRDRMGQKPLYWSMQNNLLLFGSELRALRAHRDFNAELDRDATASFIRHGYYPQPHCVYATVAQLPPGEMLTVTHDGQTNQRAYWSMPEVVKRARDNAFNGSETDAVDALDQILGTAVEARMIADVPLGAFLSGGYDSSLIVALMQHRSTRPVQTFTIGFNEAKYDESSYARQVAAHFGTDHTELIVSAQQARDVIPKLPQIYDEPFADSSQIPTFLVSRLAQRSVTVALSGDGGDELFAGYGRYIQAMQFVRGIGRIPRAGRQLIGAMMARLPLRQWDRLFAMLPQRFQMEMPGDKMHKLAGLLDTDFENFYHRLTSAWYDPEAIVLGSREPATVTMGGKNAALNLQKIESMQYRDMLHYLPGDILTKVDRASMAVGLEARAPLLDHRVVEFSWTLPVEMKLHDGTGKKVLKELACRYVPRSMLERPKTGFGIPLGEWLRGPLRDWAEDLLDEKSLREGGVFNPVPIRKRWSEHCAESRNWQYSLWNILMFEAWRRRNN